MTRTEILRELKETEKIYRELIYRYGKLKKTRDIYADIVHEGELILMFANLPEDEKKPYKIRIQKAKELLREARESLGQAEMFMMGLKNKLAELRKELHDTKHGIDGSGGRSMEAAGRSE